MAWLTEAEYLYWLDVRIGKYAKVSEPEPIIIPGDIERFLRESDLMAKPGDEFEALMGQYPV